MRQQLKQQRRGAAASTAAPVVLVLAALLHLTDGEVALTKTVIRPRPRLVSWYRTYNASAVPPMHSPDDLGQLGFTHVLAMDGTGIVADAATGALTCDKAGAAYASAAPLRAAATAHGFKLMMGAGLNATELVQGGGLHEPYFQTWLRTLPAAADACAVRGVEWDYEPTIELSPAHRRRLTEVLGAINNATDTEFDVSLDMFVWGVEFGRWGADAPLDWRPYIDVELTNTESYHWPPESRLLECKLDAAWLAFFGLDPARVNIGAPMFSMATKDQRHTGQPIWRALSQYCPDIGEDEVVCDTVYVDSRKTMRDLGTFIAQGGWGGAFPWAASYDVKGNLSLVQPLSEGMGVWRGN